MAQDTSTPFPPPPSKLHLVGLGGIGMSGLAQLLLDQGHRVSGSDRSFGSPENAPLFAKLAAAGVEILPQDGAHARHGTEALVYSSAVEPGNLDLAAFSGPRWRRAEALSAALRRQEGGRTVAVGGSCGKTTVSAWLAETLDILGRKPRALVGGLVKRFESVDRPGNYLPGDGGLTVIEADESDKSLLAFAFDIAVALNIGTDHYPEPELVELFSEFIRRARRGVVASEEVVRKLGREPFGALETAVFASGPSPGAGWRVAEYHVGRGAAMAVIDSPQGRVSVRLPAPGLHNAANACAVLAACAMLGIPPRKAAEAASSFSGVRRRFEIKGRTAAGAPVIDDYAHNVEKIASCVAAAAEIRTGRTLAIFQPHGFGPLEFMRGKLFDALESALGPRDVFAFLPVFYAGGTTSFSPSSEEVCAAYAARSPVPGRYICFPDRITAAAHVAATAKASDLVLLMGARDNSLPLWAESLAAQP